MNVVHTRSNRLRILSRTGRSSHTGFARLPVRGLSLGVVIFCVAFSLAAQTVSFEQALPSVTASLTTKYKNPDGVSLASAKLIMSPDGKPGAVLAGGDTLKVFMPNEDTLNLEEVPVKGDLAPGKQILGFRTFHGFANEWFGIFYTAESDTVSFYTLRIELGLPDNSYIADVEALGIQIPAVQTPVSLSIDNGPWSDYVLKIESNGNVRLFYVDRPYRSTIALLPETKSTDLLGFSFYKAGIDANVITMTKSSQVLPGPAQLNIFKVRENLTSSVTAAFALTSVPIGVQSNNLSGFSILYPQRVDTFSENDGVLAATGSGDLAIDASRPIVVDGAAGSVVYATLADDLMYTTPQGVLELGADDSYKKFLYSSRFDEALYIVTAAFVYKIYEDAVQRVPIDGNIVAIDTPYTLDSLFRIAVEKAGVLFIQSVSADLDLASADPVVARSKMWTDLFLDKFTESQSLVTNGATTYLLSAGDLISGVQHE